MKNSQLIKFLLAILISSAYIIVFANFGVVVYEKVFKQDTTFAKNTMIATVDVSGLSAEEASLKLIDEIDNWRANTNLTVNFKEVSEEVDLAIININIDETINQVVQGEVISFVVSVAEDELNKFTKFVDNYDGFSEEEFEKSLKNIASQLKTGKQTVQLEQFFEEEFEDETFLTVVVENTNVKADLERFSREVPQLKIEGKQRFSLLQYIDENGGTQYSNEALSTIATALYELVLQTNFTIFERHKSYQLPDYAKLGFEAKITKDEERDFSFVNPNDLSYTINVDLVNDALQLSLHGQTFKYKYEAVLIDETNVEHRTIIHYSPLLSYDESRLESDGLDGKVIKLNRQVIDEYGLKVDEQSITEDYYEPKHKIKTRSFTDERDPYEQD